MNIPRILVAAGASGSGKTLITCGILQALAERGKKVASFKCGPDYIDPMFHSRVIGTKSRNLDTYFTGRDRTRFLFQKNARDCEIAVMEGVMGYYDGVGGTSTKASAYELAKVTDTPVILVVNSKGMSVSLAAYIKGFLDYKEDHHIAGVILNQMSPMLYPRMKEFLENELGTAVLGYVPKVADCVIESRHLGLVLPEEIPQLKERLKKLAKIFEETLDLEAILQIADAAPPLLEEADPLTFHKKHLSRTVRIAAAKDEAFCFFYEDNFRLLEEMGAELVFFSPMHDPKFPENVDGLLLYGGYPELNGAMLEGNVRMRDTIKQKIREGMPCMAECGGFMYLHEEMEDIDGTIRKMAGVIPGKVYRTDRLRRFGYVALKQKQEIFGRCDLGEIPAHEFHYFDSENCGEACLAVKPTGTERTLKEQGVETGQKRSAGRSWNCMHGGERILAGFPHLHYYGNLNVPAAFLEKCEAYQKERETQKAEKRFEREGEERRMTEE